MTLAPDWFNRRHHRRTIFGNTATVGDGEDGAEKEEAEEDEDEEEGEEEEEGERGGGG